MVDSQDAVTKVLLVGTRLLSLAALRALIDNDPRLQVVGHWLHETNLSTLESSDVVLIDHGVQEAIEPLTAMVRAAAGDAPLLILTSSTDSSRLSSVFRLGVRGLVSKTRAPEVLFEAIQKVSNGEIWLDPSSATLLITDLLWKPDGKDKSRYPPSLTHRDHRIIELVARGLTNGRIGEALCVSEATVRNRLTTIFKKVGATGRLQLVVYAYQKVLVESPQTPSSAARKNALRLV